MVRTDILYVIRGAFWFGVQHIASIGGAILVSVAFANLLPKETYGTYRYILSIFSILMISNITRIDDSVSISVAKGFEGDFINAYKTRVRWGLLGGLVGIVMALYWWYLGNTLLAVLAVIISVALPVFEPPVIYNGFLIGKKKFKQMAMFAVINTAVYSILMVAVLLATKNITYILIAYIFINVAVRSAVLWYVIWSEKPNQKTEPQTLSYGKKLSILDVLGVVSNNIDSILLFHYLGPVEVAAYTFIKRMPEQIKVIPKYLTALSTPKFATKDISDPYIKKETARKTTILFLSQLGVALLYIIIAPTLFRYLFPPYQEYVWLSQIYALSMPLNFGGLFLNFIETSRKSKIVVALNTLSPVLRIVIMFVAIYSFGLSGLVWSALISKFAITLLRGYYFYLA